VFRLKRGLADHRILIFKNQRLTDREFVDFAALFGPLFAPPPDVPVLGSSVGDGTVVTIGNVAGGLLGATELDPHVDHIWTPRPSSGSLLYALEVPLTGGETRWIDLIRAYEALPLETKQEIADLRVITFNPFLQENSGSELFDRSLQPERLRYAHPLVRTHPESGRKLLFLSPYNDMEVVGMSEADGEALRRQLRDHLLDPRYAYTHRWSVGDIVYWDNTATLHGRTAFDSAERRIMRRVSLAGGPPYQ
jgi:taurine dioxygenase